MTLPRTERDAKGRLTAPAYQTPVNTFFPFWQFYGEKRFLFYAQSRSRIVSVSVGGPIRKQLPYFYVSHFEAVHFVAPASLSASTSSRATTTATAADSDGPLSAAEAFLTTN